MRWPRPRASPSSSRTSPNSFVGTDLEAQLGRLPGRAASRAAIGNLFGVVADKLDDIPD